jgi:hypothetical protein
MNKIEITKELRKMVLPPENCLNCTHYSVCYLLEVIKTNNKIKRLSAVTGFLPMPEAIGAFCQYYNRKEALDEQER